MSGEAMKAYAKRTDLRRFAPNSLAVFAVQLRFGIDDPNDLEESIIDGEKDNKCDIVYVDDESGVAIIVQAYESDNPKDNPPLNKVSDLNTAASWLIDPATLDRERPAFVSAAAQLRAAIEDSLIDRLEIWYSHNSPDNPDVQAELEQAAVTADALLARAYGEFAAGIDCVGVQIGTNTLDTLYAQRTQQILIEDTIDVGANQWLEESGPNWVAVYTTVTGDWLRDLHERYGQELLFAANVRGFLGLSVRRGGSRINQGIQRTVHDRPNDFWVFNNGITALVSEIIKLDGQLSVRGISIVNGAQTTGTLRSSNATSEVRVAARFVRSTDRELVQQIIKANNTQNQIVASDFRSNDEHQTRLRSEFTRIPNAHYTGARRGEEVALAARPDDMYISADLAAQCLAAFHGEPQRAYHDKSKIWDDQPIYERYFAATSAEHIVFVTSLVRAIQAMKQSLRGNIRRNAMEDETLAFLSLRGVPFLFAAAIAHCQDIILGRPVANTYSVSFSDQVSPAVAEEIWRPLIDSLIAFHAQLAPAAESGKIRSSDDREAALNAFRAAIYSLRTPLESVFGQFRAHVEAK